MKRFVLLALGAWLSTSAPLNAETIQPVKAAVFRSTGTIFLGQTIWPELNAGWSEFGDVPVEIDWWSLAGSNITEAKLQASGADVLIISAAGYLSYTDAEIEAITNYVQAGHGIIITYFSFLDNKRRLAPLVGLSETITLGTGTATDPFWLAPIVSDHPLLEGIAQPYVSGVREATTLWGSPPWALSGGVVVAELSNDVITPRPGIVANEAENYRGLYFSYYVENKGGGANLQDMQVFYNGLLWTGTPEPSTAALLAVAGLLALRRRNTSAMFDHPRLL